MRRYKVKEIFGPTIQGEGSLTGTVTTFLRFAGCNMWDGRAESKAASACPYCDTDFVGGTMMTAAEIVDVIAATGLADGGWVTISGGEPALQLDEPLAEMIRRRWKAAVETNGTRPVLAVVDHVTMSPKTGPRTTTVGQLDDLKVLWPHPDPTITPEAFDADPRFDGAARWLQPVNEIADVDPLAVAKTMAKLVDIATTDGRKRWGLSVQLHKLIGVQ